LQIGIGIIKIIDGKMSIDNIIENNKQYLNCSNRTLYELYTIQKQIYNISKKYDDLIKFDYFRIELLKNYYSNNIQNDK
jgi:hypothetical protein